jgi:hypothetical protein
MIRAAPMLFVIFILPVMNVMYFIQGRGHKPLI